MFLGGVMQASGNKPCVLIPVRHMSRGWSRWLKLII